MSSLLESIDAASQVLGHLATVHGGHTGLLQRIGPALELRVVVQLATVLQTTGPRKDACHGVRASWVALVTVREDSRPCLNSYIFKNLYQYFKYMHTTQIGINNKAVV